MSDTVLSDEELNAFIDGELSAPDQARVLAAIDRDEALKARLVDYQQTRNLLRHAYERPPQPPRARVVSPSWRKQALAATLLVAAGIAAGWVLHQKSVDGPFAQHAQAPKGVVIQVSEADPAKWEMALLNARNVRKAYADKSVGVEIVAYGPGLKMFHQNSPVSAGLDEMNKQGVKLLACGNTMTMTHTTRDKLNQAVEVVPAGVVEIMERQKDGYAYVRP